MGCSLPVTVPREGILGQEHGLLQVVVCFEVLGAALARCRGQRVGLWPLGRVHQRGGLRL